VVVCKTTSCRGEFRATLSSAYVPLRAMAEGGDGGRRDDPDTRINSRVTMMAAATSASANPATTAREKSSRKWHGECPAAGIITAFNEIDAARVLV
jgi:hypothetical protein